MSGKRSGPYSPTPHDIDVLNSHAKEKLTESKILSNFLEKFKYILPSKSCHEAVSFYDDNNDLMNEQENSLLFNQKYVPTVVLCKIIEFGGIDCYLNCVICCHLMYRSISYHYCCRGQHLLLKIILNELLSLKCCNMNHCKKTDDMILLNENIYCFDQKILLKSLKKLQQMHIMELLHGMITKFVGRHPLKKWMNFTIYLYDYDLSYFNSNLDDILYGLKFYDHITLFIENGFPFRYETNKKMKENKNDQFLEQQLFLESFLTFYGLYRFSINYNLICFKFFENAKKRRKPLKLHNKESITFDKISIDWKENIQCFKYLMEFGISNYNELPWFVHFLCQKSIHIGYNKENIDYILRSLQKKRLKHCWKNYKKTYMKM